MESVYLLAVYDSLQEGSVQEARDAIWTQVSKRTFEVYQYLSPAVLTPLSFWLWWSTYGGDIQLTMLAWLTPIVYAYVVPGIGTNVLKVWEFDVRFRLGRFRPHHGFVFGSATAMLAWVCHSHMAKNLWDVVVAIVVFSSVLGFWNILYDIHAIRAGILRVYNQPWADGKGPESVAMDYAPWFFGGFGAVYGAGVAGGELIAERSGFTGLVFAGWFLIVIACSIGFPVWGYRRRSFKKYGHSGCKPAAKEVV